VHRTDADPAPTSPDPSERAYGSLLGVGPTSRTSVPSASRSSRRRRLALKVVLRPDAPPAPHRSRHRGAHTGHRLPGDTCVFPAELEATAARSLDDTRLEWLSGDHYGCKPTAPTTAGTPPPTSSPNGSTGSTDAARCQVPSPPRRRSCRLVEESCAANRSGKRRELVEAEILERAALVFATRGPRRRACKTSPTRPRSAARRCTTTSAARKTCW
jgi:hypothetical protein